MDNYYKKPFEVTDDLLASQGQRFANYIIDLVCQYALIFLLAVFLAFICDLFGFYGFQQWVDESGKLGGYVIGIIMIIIYYSFFEFLFSKTIGKFITKTILVDENGNKPTWEVILKRSFCRLIPFDRLSFLGSNSRGWHDSIPNVYVVTEKELKNKKEQFYELDEIGESQEE